MTVSRVRMTWRPPAWMIAVLLVTLISVTVDAGHLFGGDHLVTVVGGLPPTSPVICLMATLCSAALVLQGPHDVGRVRLWVARFLAASVVVLAVLVLLHEHLGPGLLHDLAVVGVDPEILPPKRPPMRSPVAFILLGSGLLLLGAGERRGHWQSQVLATGAGMLVGVAALAALAGLSAITEEASATPMPLFTQALLLLLSAGLLTVRDDGLAQQVLGSPHLGGRTLRRLIPIVVAAILGVGVAVAVFHGTGRHADGLQVTVAICVLLMTLYLVLMRAGAMLNEADVSQRDLIAELREQRDFSDAVLCSLIEGVLTFGPDGTVLQVNRRWSEITGYAAGEVLGLRPPHPWWHRGLTEELLAEPGELHLEIRRSDDRMVSVLATARTIRSGCTVVTFRDLTQRDRDEAARRRTARQLDHFFTVSRDLMCIASIDGFFKRVNPALENLLGYSAQELLGRPFIEFVHPDDVDRTIMLVHRFKQGPSSTTDFENRYLARDGSYRWLNWNATVDSDGAIYAVARDTTERRKVEEALSEARDEALAAATMKSQFVAMVSHEIRTPMNGVIGLTKLLIDTPLQPVQRRYAEAIRSSSRALLTIINDILDFSKIEAGKVELAEVPFDPGELVEEVAHAGAAAIGDKDVDMLTYYPPDLPARVRGDDGRLRQVLLNLVGNAVKFTHEGNVVLRVDPLPPEPGGRPRYTFSVADTGIGIEPTEVARLFEPFTQADTGTTREYGGTGLGLSISRQLVELMGGRIHVDSAPGRGSRFSFTITLDAPDGSSAPHRRNRDGLADRRLLVIDANATSRQFLADHVRAWGMAVRTASGADDGLAELQTAVRAGEPFDLVVIDHHPSSGLDGTALMRAIDADPRLRGVRCLMLSREPAAQQEDADRHEADLLGKPVGPSSLYNYLLSRFDGSRGQHPGEKTAAPAAPAPEETAEGRILIAEDNEINQIVAIDTLESLGYQADIATNGAEAIALAAAKPYRAILMDCQMPKLDGFAATAELRRREAPDEHIPIIAMTAGVLQEDRERARQAGMDDFLAKPLNTDDLRAALDRWARR
ncbi:ATP-binding protein [Actinoplanes sp. NPDC051851]|uniref:hybrid sensor histidine kinase/response regulator n=1 Tax=Actinoplanes sp. NPDC051851 TaxID=3154753 RepID=UPI003418E861